MAVVDSQPFVSGSGYWVMKIRTFDLFCGAGGSSCGARQAGVQIVGGVDLWSRAVETFQNNFPKAKVYQCPIEELSPMAIRTEVGPVELLLSSPECTNHSVAKGNAPRDELSRRTAFQVIRFAEEWRPRWVVVENVVSMQRWDSYQEWLSRLRDLGYWTSEFKLNAQDFGAPQSRRRLFVLADRERMPRIPKARADKPTPVSSILMRGASDNGYSYRLRPLLDPGRAAPTIERANRAIEAVGRKQPFLIVYYGSDAAGGWQSLDRPLRTITTLDRFALVEPVRGGHMMRMLQPPELAAAMGFPPDYLWPEITRREHIKLIGNAVSPPVMRAIVEALVT